MLATAWEFESPLRHHKKINGLEEKVFLLARFSFAPTAILPHYAPTPGNLVNFFRVSTCRCPHFSWGRFSALTVLSSSAKLLLVIHSECPEGAFLFCQFASSSAPLVSTKQIRPPPVYGRRAKPRTHLALAMRCTINLSASCGCGVVVGWFPRPDEPAAHPIPSDKGNGLRKTKA